MNNTVEQFRELDCRQLNTNKVKTYGRGHNFPGTRLKNEYPLLVIVRLPVAAKSATVWHMIIKIALRTRKNLHVINHKRILLNI